MVARGPLEMIIDQGRTHIITRGILDRRDRDKDRDKGKGKLEDSRLSITGITQRKEQGDD